MDEFINGLGDGSFFSFCSISNFSKKENFMITKTSSIRNKSSDSAYIIKSSSFVFLEIINSNGDVSIE